MDKLILFIIIIELFNLQLYYFKSFVKQGTLPPCPNIHLATSGIMKAIKLHSAMGGFKHGYAGDAVCS
jgi:hypothetical protein